MPPALFRSTSVLCTKTSRSPSRSQLRALACLRDLSRLTRATVSKCAFVRFHVQLRNAMAVSLASVAVGARLLHPTWAPSPSCAAPQARSTALTSTCRTSFCAGKGSPLQGRSRRKCPCTRESQDSVNHKIPSESYCVNHLVSPKIANREGLGNLAQSRQG